MGTHGCSGLRPAGRSVGGAPTQGHFMRGSVAEQVIRRAVCPVLTIRVVDQDGREDGAQTETGR
jgi:nucleotide-binding universal stress UspA family protein